MKKKIMTFALALIIAISAFGITALAESVIPSPSTVSVNGVGKAFEAYNIDGYNFFKLRDLAFVLNGTEKQFEVGYDGATKEITLTSGEPYTVVGGEMAKGNGGEKTATLTASRIFFNGMELNPTVYNIGGNNFFKLRDLMRVLGVYVGYDDATKAITLDTSREYVPDGALLTALEAKELIYAWLADHPDVTEFDLDNYAYDIFGYNNEEFYRFHYSPKYYLDFLVNSKTGELWCRQITDGEFPDDPVIEPLEDYYNRYYGE